jgi:hypothetical protein
LSCCRLLKAGSRRIKSKRERAVCIYLEYPEKQEEGKNEKGSFLRVKGSGATNAALCQTLFHLSLNHKKILGIISELF